MQSSWDVLFREHDEANNAEKIHTYDMIYVAMISNM